MFEHLHYETYKRSDSSPRKLCKGTNIRTEGAYLIFHFTFLYKVVSEIDNSDNFQSLYIAKSFLN